MNAAPEIEFSSQEGKANYEAARRRYPAQAIVDLKAMRDNMAHLVNVVGGSHSGTAVMGVVKADAYGHGLLPAALAALAGGATWLGTAQSHEALLLRKLGIGPDRCHILTWVYNGAEVPFDELIANDIDVSVFPTTWRPADTVERDSATPDARARHPRRIRVRATHDAAS